MSYRRKTLQQLVLFKENSNRNYHISLHHLELAPKQLSKFTYLITVVAIQRHNIQGSLWLAFILKRNADVQDPKNSVGNREYYVKQKSYQISS